MGSVRRPHLNLPPDARGYWWAIAALVATTLLATLTPAPEWPEARRHFFSSLYPTTGASWADILANVLFYAPLGLALGLSGAAPSRAALVAGVLSLTTELLQFVVPGRDPRASDVVANVLGSWLGAAVAITPAGVFVNRAASRVGRQTSRALARGGWLGGAIALTCIGVLVAALTVTGILVKPSLPDSDYAVTTFLVDAAPSGLRVGSNGHPGGYFRGLIDDVRVYRGARAREAIQGDMNRAVSSEPSDDLLAAFSFDDVLGATTPDSAGLGHAATVQGATTVDHGRHGRALSFDGIDDVVVVDPARDLNLRQAFTLEAWIFPLEQRSNEPVVIAHADDTYHLSGSPVAGSFRPAVGGTFGGVFDDAGAPGALPSNLWTHVAAIYDGESFRLYLDGSLVRSKRRWSSHRVIEASLDGVGLGSGIVSDPRWLRSALARPLEIRLAILCGEPHAGAAPVFRIVAPGNTTMLSLTSAGSDLFVRWAMQPSRRLHMPTPSLVVTKALDGCTPGRTIQVELSGPLPRLRAARDGRQLNVDAPGPGSGWAFLLHSELMPAWLQRIGTWLWLAALAVPAGMCIRSRRVAMLAVALVTGAAIALPVFLDVAPFEFWHVAGLASGAGLGALVRGRGTAGEATSASP
jgi:VanZ family protein